ncbi:MAG: sulfurtransferase TusA family protein [Limnohabitans sp.]|jgi:TusA-related sulfurtransferase
MSIAFDVELDTCGLNCPLPILKAKKALTAMQAGQVLKILATDPGSLRDFEAFARQTGNELLSQMTEGERFIHWMKRR